MCSLTHPSFNDAVSMMKCEVNYCRCAMQANDFNRVSTFSGYFSTVCKTSKRIQNSKHLL